MIEIKNKNAQNGQRQLQQQQKKPTAGVLDVFLDGGTFSSSFKSVYTGFLAVSAL